MGRRLRYGCGTTLLIVSLLLLAIVRPWEPSALEKDVRSHSELFHQVAQVMLAGASDNVVLTADSIDPLMSNESVRQLFRMGYWRIENDSGVVVFYRYRTFLDIGLLGVAVGPKGETQLSNGFALTPLWDDFYEVEGG